MDIFLLWLFAQSNAITEALGVLTVMGFIVIGLSIIGWVINHAIIGDNHSLDRDEKRERHREVKKQWVSGIKKLVAMVLVVGTLNITMPDREGLAIIVGGKLAIEGITSETVTGTASKLFDVVDAELDNRLEQIQNERESNNDDDTEQEQ